MAEPASAYPRNSAYTAKRPEAILRVPVTPDTSWSLWGIEFPLQIARLVRRCQSRMLCPREVEGTIREAKTKSGFKIMLRRDRPSRRNRGKKVSHHVAALFDWNPHANKNQVWELGPLELFGGKIREVRCFDEGNGYQRLAYQDLIAANWVYAPSVTLPK